MKLWGIEYNEYHKEFIKCLMKLDNKFSFFEFQTPRKSMCNVELFVMYGYIRHYKPEVVFESGIFRGRSTVVLAAALDLNGSGRVFAASTTKEHKEPRIYAKHFPITMCYQPGEIVVRTMSLSSLTVMVIDGPKPARERGPVYDIYNHAMLMNVLGLFQHDVKEGEKQVNFDSFAARNGISSFHLSEQFYTQYKGLDDSGRCKAGNLGLFRFSS